MTNISISDPTLTPIADLLRVLGQPVRVQILLTIGRREVCVCHIEASLGLRQAAISQHLMILRSAGFVSTYRSGRNIYYRLVRVELLDLIIQAAHLAGVPQEELVRLMHSPVTECPCPDCTTDPAQSSCSPADPVTG